MRARLLMMVLEVAKRPSVVLAHPAAQAALVKVAAIAPASLRRSLRRLDFGMDLVPMDALTASYGAALERLAAGDRAGAVNDGPFTYLEFGVNKGSSIVCVSRALRAQSAIREWRIVGFDSFEGLPEETVTVAGQGGDSWRPGDFASSLHNTQTYLQVHDVPLDSVELVKGWFSDTLNDATCERLGIERADLVMIDCDIYTGALEALEFCAPLLADRAIVVFDDWGDAHAAEIGEQRAFREFRAAHPELDARELPTLQYRPESCAFEITRRQR